MRPRIFALLMSVSLLLAANPASAVWQVDFQSKSVGQGETGVTVALTAYWDLNMGSFTVPVIVRSTSGGAFWVTPLPVDTVGGPVVGVQWNWSNPGWAVLVEQVRPGLPGCNPEGDIGYDAVSPDHFVVNAAGVGGPFFTPPEPTGRDILTLTIDVNCSLGDFVFDTACYTSSLDRIYMIDNVNFEEHGPGGIGDFNGFNKGVITIVPGPPVARFSGTPTSGCAPLSVDFTDESCGDITSWAWDFGDAGTSQDQNPTHVYASPGTYTVKLTVTGPQGSDDEEKTDYITVTENLNPQITCPGPITVQCVNDVPPVAADSAEFVAQGGSITDDCGPVTLTHVGDGPLMGGPCGGTITRTYRATDAAAKTAECTQTITVDDTEDPQINCPAAHTVQCETDVPPAATTLAAFIAQGGSASDNCDNDLTFEHVSDGPLTGGACGGTTTRTYRVTDDCGNSAECTQVFTVNDTQEPVITCPGPITVQCETDVPPAATTLPAFIALGGSASDNCDDDLTFAHVGDGPLMGGPCGGTITRTYRVTDDCGNIKECIQTITIDDTEDPQITCPDPISVQCASEIPAPAANLTEFVNLGGSASDNCGTVTVIHVGDGPPPVGAPNGGGIARTYRAIDGCGNIAECIQTITIDDTQEPQITCPGPISVQCSGDVPPPAADSTEFVALGGTVSDNCGVLTVTHVQDSPSGTCPKTITRYYRATDPAGNYAECKQTITVNDTQDPQITCPGPATVECEADVPAAATNLAEFVALGGSASDNCGTLTVTHVGDDPLSGGSCGGTITRTYRATDGCGNTTDCTQTITVSDTQDPQISCPPAQTVQCETDVPAAATTLAEFIALGGSASDNCDNDLAFVYVGDGPLTGGPCGGTITRTYRVTDDCNNFAECTQVFTVNDTEKPQITCPAPISVLYAADVPAPATNWTEFIDQGGSATDNCVTVTVAHVSDVSDGQKCPETITRTYRATDGCDNSDDCTQLITVEKVPNELSAEPTSFFFEHLIGEDPPEAQTLHIFNPGCNDLDFTADTDADWLSVDPTSGTTPKDLNVSVDVTDKEPGSYEANVEITEATFAALNGPLLIPVTLKVSEGYDSCWVAQNVSDTLGAKIAVPITFENGRELAAVGIPLTWDTEIVSAWNPNAIFLDSVSFAGSRVDYLADTSSSIDNDANTVLLDVVVGQGEDFIEAGKGLFATLYFEIVECSDDTIVIDTTSEVGDFEFLDPGMNEVPTGFVPGSIIVEPGELRVFLTPNEFYFQATVGGENPDCQTLILETDFCGVGGWGVRYESDWMTVDPESGPLPGTTEVCVDISSFQEEGTYKDTFKVQLALPVTKLSSGDGIPTWIVEVTLDMSKTGIFEEESGVPNRYFLAQNYPNPFNPSTAIAFGLETAGHTTITVYNLLGQTVSVLVDEYLPAGSHVAVWDRKGQSGQTLPSGIYFYRIRSGDFEQTRKMVLMK